ncbi:tryptophanase, partial [bacterium]|nr:tryptophanase [bacterium]
FRLEKVIQDIIGLPFVMPVHQGRAAEQVLNFLLINKGDAVPGNSHFDTTKAHIEIRGGRAIDCTIDEGRESGLEHPFKGNLDIKKLQSAFEKYGKEKIPYVLITITCNSGGGQPVSMKNIKEVSSFCKKNNLRLFFDAARFAENAYFIQQREDVYKNKLVKEIVKEMFSYVDGCTMSAKKDGLVPIGGFLAFRDQKLYDQLQPYEILFEGYSTYGGMSGMDMEAMAQGLTEVIEDDYLAYRIGQTQYLGDRLAKKEVSIVKPVGGHAVFIDGRKFFPNVPEDQFPAQLLVIELYKEGGIRAVEIGSCLAGRDPDTGDNIRPSMDLCRLSIPRRVYTKEHLDYVADVVETVHQNHKNRKTGLTFDKEGCGIRHFTSTFKYL